MGRSQETFHKKEVRNKKEKKRKEKEKKRLARKEEGSKSNSLDDMIAYVDENGMISDTPPDPESKTETSLEDIVIDVPKKEEDENYDPLRKGRVSYYNDSKGYGFIRDDKSKESLFFHVNDLLDEVTEGNQVTFEKGKGQKGPVALQVRLFKEAGK